MKKIKPVIFKIIKILGIILVILFFISVFQVLYVKFVNPASSNLMIHREKLIDKQKTKYKRKFKWMPLTKISKYLQKSVIAAEDSHFYEHSGFEFSALKNAYARRSFRKRR